MALKLIENTSKTSGVQWSGRLIYGRFVKSKKLTLQAGLERTFAGRRADGFGGLSGSALTLGCETRRVAAEYRWDGMRRGDDPAHPHVVFQATLAGWGSFERGPRRWRVGEGMVFFAVLPSPHVYRLPEDSPAWSFFWLNFGHPWIVERITALAVRHPPVVPLPEESKLMAVSRSFFERVCAVRFEDGIAEEGAALEWLLEFERHLHELAHPRGRREMMIAEVRAYTLANLGRSFGVEELARRHGMSRSHFSHQFRAATGVAPAAQVLEMRLAEVRRRLRETGEPLKDIAGVTGFADANHLCKAFRRAFHLSPGMFRRQVR